MFKYKNTKTTFTIEIDEQFISDLQSISIYLRDIESIVLNNTGKKMIADFYKDNKNDFEKLFAKLKKYKEGN